MWSGKHPRRVCRFNIFTGCPEAKTCTIILRGGAEQFIEETERSLHDAIMIVRRTIKNDAIVAGEGGKEGLWGWSVCVRERGGRGGVYLVKSVGE